MASDPQYWMDDQEWHQELNLLAPVARRQDLVAYGEQSGYCLQRCWCGKYEGGRFRGLVCERDGVTVECTDEDCTLAEHDADPSAYGPDPQPVLDPDTIYVAGMRDTCVECATPAMLYAGRDFDGRPVLPLAPEQFTVSVLPGVLDRVLPEVACECGRLRASLDQDGQVETRSSR